MGKYHWTVKVIRACYWLDGTDREWLSALTSALLGAFPKNAGGMGCFFRTRPGRLEIADTGTKRCADGDARRFVELCADSAAKWQERLGADKGWCWSIRGNQLQDMSAGAHLEVGDCLSLWATDGQETGCIFLFPVAQRSSLTNGKSQILQNLALHISMGYWLRRHAGAAFLSTLGNAEHVQAQTLDSAPAEPAEDGSGVAAWRSIAMVLDRQYGHADRSGAAIAVDVCHGFLDGTWSLLVHWEQGGRRYVLARKASPDACRWLALTPRERQSVQLALEALRYQSYNAIAETVDRAETTVANYLWSAMRKARRSVQSRASRRARTASRCIAEVEEYPIDHSSEQLVCSDGQALPFTTRGYQQ